MFLLNQVSAPLFYFSIKCSSYTFMLPISYASSLKVLEDCVGGITRIAGLKLLQRHTILHGCSSTSLMIFSSVFYGSAFDCNSEQAVGDVKGYGNYPNCTATIAHAIDTKFTAQDMP